MHAPIKSRNKQSYAVSGTFINWNSFPVCIFISFKTARMGVTMPISSFSFNPTNMPTAYGARSQTTTNAPESPLSAKAVLSILEIPISIVIVPFVYHSTALGFTSPLVVEVERPVLLTSMPGERSLMPASGAKGFRNFEVGSEFLARLFGVSS